MPPSTYRKGAAALAIRYGLAPCFLGWVIVAATAGEIAERIGRPEAVRAAAQACASNKLAVAVPCHRVVRRDGKLGGYRWGVERKRELLLRESEKSEGAK